MITLIATGHKENGFCNSDELYKVIEQIGPEIIFEEIPPGKFAAVYNGLRSDSLETFTVKRYLKKYTAIHVPVDFDIDENIEFCIKSDTDHLFKLFSTHSLEYNDLSNQHGHLAGLHGFPYLNSNQCEMILERKRLLEEVILNTFNDDSLWQKYKNWRSFLNDREMEMITNIYSYNLTKYERAVFLVGAEHRKPIMDKIARFEKDSNQALN